MPKRIRTIADLESDSHNANQGTERGRAMIEQSFRDYGAGRSVLADREGRVIAGNKSLEVAAELGLAVREIHTTGDELVVVVRDDLDLAADPAARELAYADNRAQQVSLSWDAAVLAADLEAGVPLAGLFGEEGLAAALAALDGQTPDGGGAVGDPDATPDAPEDPVSRPGDVWVLGRHRLAVGDCTEVGVIDRLLGGDEADLVVTDPPYGVAYEGTATKERDAIENDDLGDEGTRQLVRDALVTAPLKKGGAFYVCAPPGETELQFRLALADAGWDLHQCIAWIKQRFNFGRSDYHYRHEPILYGWRPGAGHFFVDDRTQDTAWEIDRPARSEDHPTMKPPALFQRAVANSSRPGEIVLDLFAGSGTILIACETTGRRARAVELEPKYADVCVARWCDFTGQDATREADGASWRALAAREVAA